MCAPFSGWYVYRFFLRPVRRLKNEPDVLQDTLSYSFSVLLMWSAYVGTRSWGLAAHVLALDMLGGAAVRGLNSARVGRLLGLREKQVIRWSGLAPFVVGISLILFGHASIVVLSVVAAANGFLMGHAALIRNRANLRKPTTSRACSARRLPFYSSGGGVYSVMSWGLSRLCMRREDFLGGSPAIGMLLNFPKNWARSLFSSERSIPWLARGLLRRQPRKPPRKAFAFQSPTALLRGNRPAQTIFYPAFHGVFIAGPSL